MPVTHKIEEDYQTVILTLAGKCTAEELQLKIVEVVIPYLYTLQPIVGHIIFDVTQFDIEFLDFVKYLANVRERRESSTTPDATQHFVGNNQWFQSFRNWLNANFSEQVTTHESIAEALAYIDTTF